ncbi:hypothetical protein [uncultured Sphingomonas sp.]|uniref:hypothetical protein n=1 Tax=uncultured Sphingomonas sp. TaxID=158754 RepID=UPI0035CBE2FA
MFMAPPVRARPARPRALHRVVGAPALLIAAVFMLPWLVLYAAYGLIALALRNVVKGPRTLVAMVDYAGEVLIGR